MARAKMHVDITANNHVESPRPLSAISDTSTVLEHGPVLMEKFKEFLERYEIKAKTSNDLLKFKGFEIVFICDDSSSMILPIGRLQNFANPLPSRWDELRKLVSIIVDLSLCLDPDGVDVHFLNRPHVTVVDNSKQLLESFSKPPKGQTPIVRVLRKILETKQQQIRDRQLMIIIATDGAPTNERGSPDPLSLMKVLKDERNPIDRIPVRIITFTDDDESMSYLNGWEENIPNLSILQSFHKKSRKQTGGDKQFAAFNYGEYIAQILNGR